MRELFVPAEIKNSNLKSVFAHAKSVFAQAVYVFPPPALKFKVKSDLKLKYFTICASRDFYVILAKVFSVILCVWILRMK